jgi:hypothetical protein
MTLLISFLPNSYFQKLLEVLDLKFQLPLPLALVKHENFIPY